MAIPGYEKAGKGVQLRKAVEYMAELGERVMAAEKDVEELRKEKQDLEVCAVSPILSVSSLAANALLACSTPMFVLETAWSMDIAST